MQSEHIPRGSNISTIRISMVTVDDVLIMRDQRQNSIISGVSALGGLWTFMGGFFVIVFGISLTRSLFGEHKTLARLTELTNGCPLPALGSKPVSIFGLVHQVDPDGVKKGFMEGYDGLATDLTTPEQGLAMLSFLRDHVIEMDSLPTVADRELIPGSHRRLLAKDLEDDIELTA